MSFPPATTAATSSNALRSRWKRRIRGKVHSWGRGIKNVSRRLRDAIGTSSKRIWRGTVDEEEKVVLKRGSKRAIFKCWVHLLAVSATTALAYFNLAGFFIGSEFQGLTGGTDQAIDTLCLQVTAKLLVCVSVLSPY